MQWTEKSRLEVCFFIQKTSRLAGRFNFVRVDLKLSVKVGTIFLRLRRYYFSFKWDFFGGQENVLGECYAKAGWAAQNKVRNSVWRAFDIWQGCLLRLKITYARHFKLSVHFFLEIRGCNFSSRDIAAHVRSNQNKQCAVHHGKCQWVFNIFGEIESLNAFHVSFLSCQPQVWTP